jgi:hypothetical protein
MITLPQLFMIVTVIHLLFLYNILTRLINNFISFIKTQTVLDKDQHQFNKKVTEIFEQLK